MSDVERPAEAESHRFPTLWEAKIRPGYGGDFSVLVWVRTEAEAEEIAELIDERLGRNPEAEGEEP